MSGLGHQKLWQNYQDFSSHRGNLVAEVLSEYVPLNGSTLLDAGCGSGGIAAILAGRGAKVLAVDITPPAAAHKNIRWISQPIESLTLAAACDAVVLWDVLEHVTDHHHALAALSRSLKPNGVMLLATPNRHSWINALCDPHYGLPLVSLMRRVQVRLIVADWLGWHKPDKADFPELLSLTEIDRALSTAGFSWQFINRQVYDAAMENPAGLWNRTLHLRLIALIGKFKLQRLLRNLVSDRVGWMNDCTMPTFFVLARKK